MAHTKSLGSTKNSRDSRSQRLGVKRNQNEMVGPGEIIIRQRGTHYIPGRNARRGDYATLYAAKAGAGKFKTRRKTLFDGRMRTAKVVEVTALKS